MRQSNRKLEVLISLTGQQTSSVLTPALSMSASLSFPIFSPSLNQSLCTLAQCASILHWGKMMPVFHLAKSPTTIIPLGAMGSEEYDLQCNVDFAVSPKQILYDSISNSMFSLNQILSYWKAE